MAPDELFEVTGQLQGVLNCGEGAQLVAAAHAASHETRLTDRGPVQVHHGAGFIDAMAPTEVSLATGIGQWAAGGGSPSGAALTQRFPLMLAKVLAGEVCPATAQRVVTVCEGWTRPRARRSTRSWPASWPSWTRGGCRRSPAGSPPGSRLTRCGRRSAVPVGTGSWRPARARTVRRGGRRCCPRRPRRWRGRRSPRWVRSTPRRMSRSARTRPARTRSPTCCCATWTSPRRSPSASPSSPTPPPRTLLPTPTPTPHARHRRHEQRGLRRGRARRDRARGR
jgi:hypothetical protein